MSTDAMIGFVKDLQTHPTEIEELSFEYAWLESPLAAKLAWTNDVPDWREAGTWPAGRLFGEMGEYRWQQRGNNKLHCVLLLEKQGLFAGFKNTAINLDFENESFYLLWGDQVAEFDEEPETNTTGGIRFYAQEIPQVQCYPLSQQEDPSGKSPYLIVRRYRGSKGEGEFLRCAGLVLKTTETGV